MQVENVKKGFPYIMFGDGHLASCKPISEADLASFMADCIEEEQKINQVLPIGGMQLHELLGPLYQKHVLSLLQVPCYDVWQFGLGSCLLSWSVVDQCPCNLPGSLQASHPALCARRHSSFCTCEGLQEHQQPYSRPTAHLINQCCTIVG